MTLTSNITKYLVVFFSISLSSCATDEEMAGWQTWHEQYVEDACSRCPDCCIETTKEGFIDPYGVERPANWLPESDGGI